MYLRRDLSGWSWVWCFVGFGLRLVFATWIRYVVCFAFAFSIVLLAFNPGYYGYCCNGNTRNTQDQLGGGEALSGFANQRAAVPQQVVDFIMVALEDDVISTFQRPRNIFWCNWVDLFL